MAASRDLRFNLFGSDRGASRTLDNVGDKAEGLGKKLGNLAKMAGIGLAVAKIGQGFASVIRGGMEEFSGNQEAMAQFEAGLKSTGKVAGITGEQMQSLADSIEAKTGTDGAAVVSGGAMLATFTKVRNEVGKGNDVFSRATQAGVDLAARGFGSVESNAVLLGKALNDPVKGLTALGKQGITFTADQKKTIKSLVETGKTLEAQKIILKEVEGQVGGSAEAYGKTLPGQMARAQHAMDGVKESVFKALLPAFSGALELLTGRVFPALSTLAGWFGDKIVPAIKIFSEALRFGGMNEFEGKLKTVNNAGARLHDFFHGRLLPAFRAIKTYVMEQVVPAVTTLAQRIAGGLRSAFDTISRKIQENRPQIDQLVSAFRSLGDFIVTRVVPIIGTVLQHHFKRMGEIIGMGITVVGKLVSAFNAIKGPVGSALAFIVQKVLWFADTTVNAAAKAFGWVPGLGGKLKAASDAVSAFKDKVNRELAALTQEKTVRVNLVVNGVNTLDGALAKLDRLDRGMGRVSVAPRAGVASRPAAVVGSRPAPGRSRNNQSVTVNVGGRTIARAVNEQNAGRAARGARVIAVP